MLVKQDGKQEFRVFAEFGAHVGKIQHLFGVESGMTLALPEYFSFHPIFFYTKMFTNIFMRACVVFIVVSSTFRGNEC